MGIASFLTLVLIKGGLISQKNVGTATLSWGGAYKPGGLSSSSSMFITPGGTKPKGP